MRHYITGQYNEHNPDPADGELLADITCNRAGCDAISGPDRAYCSKACRDADTEE
jgi:hypothetical protein